MTFSRTYNAIVYPLLVALLGALVVRDWREGLLTVGCVAGVLAVPNLKGSVCRK